MHFADRLTERMKATNSAVCVGVDPRWGMLPEDLRNRAIEVKSDLAEAAAWAYVELAKTIIEATGEFAAAVKPQAAFFEALGSAGFRAYEDVIALCRDAGLVTIADAKRGDIGSTSTAYAQAFFGGTEIMSQKLPGVGADSLTVNPYFGTDGVKPFLDSCDENNAGLFILVRTSNPTAKEIQHQVLAGGHEVYHKVAELVNTWGESRLGECGYSSVGAVAGATCKEDLAQVRTLLPKSILLVPGYGAQGGGADDVIDAFDAGGVGAVVNASRSIVFADKNASTLGELKLAAQNAARDMRDAIAEKLAAR